MKLKITYLKATVLLTLLLVANFFISKLDSNLYIIICTCLINLIVAFTCVNLFKYFTISTENDSKTSIISIVGAVGFIIVNMAIGSVFQLIAYEKISLNNEHYPLIAVLAKVLLFPIVEEILYRRVLTEGLYNQYGFKPALFLSAFCFSIMHFFSDSGLLVVFLGGLFLGYVYLKTRNLLLVIGLHVVINSFIFFLSNSILAPLSKLSVTYSLVILVLFLLIGFYLLFFLKKLKHNAVENISDRN